MYAVLMFPLFLSSFLPMDDSDHAYVWNEQYSTSILANHPSDSLVVVKLTSGPKQHWFGYYDKLQVDPTGRYVLACEGDHFFRSPQVEDTLRIGIIDLTKNNKWTEIGTTTAWSWQQTCMLQWIPGSEEEVIWNDRGENGVISRVYNVKTGEMRILPKAIYTLSPDGTFALCVDFDRLQFFRPGYGYASSSAKEWEKAPTQEGIYKMNLQTGDSELIISYADIAKLGGVASTYASDFHWFNHLLINPAGDRFIFLNRSRPVADIEDMREFVTQHPAYQKKGFSSVYSTRAITADINGANLYLLNNSGQFSHFIWKGTEEICAWAVPEDRETAGFYVFNDRSKDYYSVGEDIMTHNGHNTYVSGTAYEWILNDTYPLGGDRLQELYVFHVPTNKKVSLGTFHEPAEYSGEWRCDLHPKSSSDGKYVLFDSTHGGDGRQVYMVEIREVIRDIE